jgi:hypothetical protein
MEDTDKVSAAAKWSVGTGDVLAFAFAPTPDEIAAVEQAIARRPRDPRFNITWHAGPTLHLRIDARDNDTFLNDQKLTIDLNLLSAVFTIPQTGPGRYEIELPAPRSPMTVTIFNDSTCSTNLPSREDIRESLMRWGMTWTPFARWPSEVEGASSSHRSTENWNSPTRGE